MVHLPLLSFEFDAVWWPVCHYFTFQADSMVHLPLLSFEFDEPGFVCAEHDAGSSANTARRARESLHWGGAHACTRGRRGAD